DLTYQKYMDLVMMGFASTSKEAEFEQLGNTQTATIEFGFVSYDNLKKKYDVKVTDDEINAYIKKHAKSFEREAMVNLSYVYFASQPSNKDEETAFNEIQKFLTKTVNVDQVNNIT